MVVVSAPPITSAAVAPTAPAVDAEVETTAMASALDRTARPSSGIWASQASGPLEDLPLFAAIRPASAPEPSGPSPVEAALDAMNPDDLSPKAALEALYGLKRLRAGGPAK